MHLTCCHGFPPTATSLFSIYVSLLNKQLHNLQDFIPAIDSLMHFSHQQASVPGMSMCPGAPRSWLWPCQECFLSDLLLHFLVGLRHLQHLMEPLLQDSHLVQSIVWECKNLSSASRQRSTSSLFSSCHSRTLSWAEQHPFWVLPSPVLPQHLGLCLCMLEQALALRPLVTASGPCCSCWCLATFSPLAVFQFPAASTHSVVVLFSSVICKTWAR